MVPLALLPGALSELFVQISLTSEMTLADRYGILAAILDESLSEEDQQSLNRLLHAWMRGRVQVVSELSAINCRCYR